MKLQAEATHTESISQMENFFRSIEEEKLQKSWKANPWNDSLKRVAM